MTIVIAEKFGDRIVICSDTKVSSKRDTLIDSIPGRLKIIQINGYFSIAYSGDADPGLQAIRAAYKSFREFGPDAAIEILIKASIPPQSPSEGQGVDFLIATHLPNAELRKISNGNITSTEFGFVIGSNKYRDTTIRKIQNLRSSSISNSPEIVSMHNEGIMHATLEESNFRFSFDNLFFDKELLDTPFGGIPITLTASPYGHFYNSGGSAQGWLNYDDIQSGRVSDLHKSGTNSFSYNVVASQMRGAGVVAVCVPKARLGYIYNPLNSGGNPRYTDKVKKIEYLVSGIENEQDEIALLEETQSIIDKIAASMGGFYND